MAARLKQAGPERGLVCLQLHGHSRAESGVPEQEDNTLQCRWTAYLELGIISWSCVERTQSNLQYHQRPPDVSKSAAVTSRPSFAYGRYISLCWAPLFHSAAVSGQGHIICFSSSHLTNRKHEKNPLPSKETIEQEKQAGSS
ncbi:hypothetical protein AOLI_G00080430 [Acnodon oligacanthus]